MNTTLLGLPIWPWWVVGGVLLLLAIYFICSGKEGKASAEEEAKAPVKDVKAPVEEVKAPVEEEVKKVEEPAPVAEEPAPAPEEPKVEPVAPEVIEGWAKEAEDLFAAGGNDNLTKAYGLFSKAAEQGDVASLLRTGYMSFLAYGTGQDVKKTVAAYQKAMELGSGKAAYLLGNLYKHGFGVEQSGEEAERLYALAKEKGYEG